MRLLEFIQPIMELRGVSAEGASLQDGALIAYKGYYWVLPGYGTEVDQEIVNQIVQVTGLEDVEDSMDLEDRMDELGEVRPDIIVGRLYNHVLHINNHNIASHTPDTSSMIKKVVAELGLRGVEIDGITHDDGPKSDLVSPSEMTGKLPEVLYHGTSSAKMSSILRLGLTVGNDTNWADQDIRHSNLIFGATRPAGAEYHANKTSGVRGEPSYDPDDPFPVVLELKIPDPDRLVPDYDVAANTGNAELGDQLGYTDSHTFHRTAGDVDANVIDPDGRQWRSASAFGYMGRIPPKWITGVYANFENGGPIDTDDAWYGSVAEYLEQLEELKRERYGDFDDEDY